MQGVARRIKKSRRKGAKKGNIQFYIGPTSEPLARGIELFLMFLEIYLELSGLVFYYT